MRPRATSRHCRLCDRTLPAENFAYKRVKTTGRPYTAATCNDCARAAQVRGRGPHWALNPCVNCGKRFKVVGTYSHVKRLKTCSHLCLRKRRETNKRKCTRCCRRLPVLEFDWYPHNPRKRKPACRRCCDQAVKDIKFAGVQRRSARFMLSKAQEYARNAEQQITLSIKDARKLFEGDCYVCGHAPHCFRPKANETTWSLQTVRAYCRVCAKLVQLMGEAVAILYGNEIASRHPLIPPPEETTEQGEEDECSILLG